jgi:hypothetical protein
VSYEIENRNLEQLAELTRLRSDNVMLGEALLLAIRHYEVGATMPHEEAEVLRAGLRIVREGRQS